MSNHMKFYNKAEYYDIAFDFRNIPEESDFLESVFKKFTGRETKSFIELAAGPAWYAIEFAKRGRMAGALDLCQFMVDYGLNKARSEGVSVNYWCANMVDFKLPEKFDMAVLMLTSASYLLDNESVYLHLESVAQCLQEGGIYILEMSHPRDVFRVGNSGVNLEWEEKRENKRVKIQWGTKDDNFDPVAQITDVTVKMQFFNNGDSLEIVDQSYQRCFSVNEFKALVEASGKLKLVAMYGAKDLNVPLTNGEESWRMIPVLQKR